MARLRPVILAGGGGARLWPLSRRDEPKQFLRLLGEHSMLQQTCLRLQGMETQATLLPPRVLCHESHRFLVQEQLQEIHVQPEPLVLEPVSRNTAPSLAVAALRELGEEQGEETVLLLLPADHHIADPQEFRSCVLLALDCAAQGKLTQGKLLTFGIPAATPETGYGYIRCGEPINENANVRRLDSFVEKPNREHAERLLQEGDALWNSGMFMGRAQVWAEHMKQICPEIHAACETSLRQGTADGEFFRLEEDAYAACPENSIDYALMEPLSQRPDSPLAVAPMAVAGWSDMGSWQAVWDQSNKNADDNHISGDVLAEDTRGCELHAGHRLLATQGCRDLVIVETADAVLVVPRDQSQKVKDLVQSLRKRGREEAERHRKVLRPWGSYETVDAGEYFQVKRLVVKPHCRLSLQYHHKRAEHWVVVRGTATVTRGEEQLTLEANQSTYIPLGMQHRLANETDETLEVIEVQSGEYLGEDDIVRVQDDFHRN